MKRYPAIEFMTRHGRRCAICVAVISAMGGLVAGVLYSSSTLAALSIFGGLCIGACLRLAAEVIEVIADTLLPR